VGTAQFWWDSEEVGTNYCGPGVRKGTLGQAMLLMFLYFLVVPICCFTNPEKSFTGVWTSSLQPWFGWILAFQCVILVWLRLILMFVKIVLLWHFSHLLCLLHMVLFRVAMFNFNIFSLTQDWSLVPKMFISKIYVKCNASYTVLRKWMTWIM
jgi:hypothetical protein